MELRYENLPASLRIAWLAFFDQGHQVGEQGVNAVGQGVDLAVDVNFDGLGLRNRLNRFQDSRVGLSDSSMCCGMEPPSVRILWTAPSSLGRMALPNCMTNSVLLYDNAGNVILEFGKYGNFDSQFVNPFQADEKKGTATVSLPKIPLAWPTGSGFGRDHIYVNDAYNRRAVRVDLTFKGEETCDVR